MNEKPNGALLQLDCREYDTLPSYLPLTIAGNDRKDARCALHIVRFALLD